MTGPTIGWKPAKWKGAKVSCSKCGKGVRQGIVHVNDRDRPPRRVLCQVCYQVIMSPDGRNPIAGSPEEGRFEHVD